MKNQEQEISSKRLLMKSINFFVVSGKVCCECEFKKSHNRLFARARLKIRAYTGKSYAYVDIFGFGDIAQAMNLTCRLGNIVYVEAHLTNKIYVNKKGEKKAKMYFMVDNIEILKAAKNPVRDSNDLLTIMDDLDPFNYLGEEFK